MYIVIPKHVSVVSSGSYWNIIFDITHERQYNQNWMQIFPVNLYNRIPVICEKACKKDSLRNFTSHYIPSSIGNVCTPAHASFRTCFQVKYVPGMGLYKRWLLIKSPILCLDCCVFKVNERGLIRKTASGFTFWWKFQLSTKICNQRNKKVHLTKKGPFSSIFFSQQFLYGF